MKGGALMLWDRKSIHTIHCFGDSLTAGYGALPCEGWVEVLAKRHPKMGWYNDSQCGALTEDILDALEGTAALAGPKEGFFFMGGTNDILCGFRLAVVEAEVKERLARLSEKSRLRSVSRRLRRRRAFGRAGRAKRCMREIRQILRRMGIS